MPPDSPTAPLSPSNRREYYRITVPLPICLQRETDSTEPMPVQRAVNLSAGGIGVTINAPVQTDEILSCTLLLPDHDPFKVQLEVLRIDPLPTSPLTYRLHGRFIQMSTQDRELLVRVILQLQREHLTKHYSA
jgi:c-di-GMP-binding flagellar brake protein YcgR